MSHIYSELDLRKLKGQAVKDIWHQMIGKPAGLKNTTGLKNNEEIIQAILQGQSDPSFLHSFHHKAPKQEKEYQKVEEPMPPKKEAQKIQIPKDKASKKLLAYESEDQPRRVDEVIRICVEKTIVEGREYYLERKTNKLYSVKDGRPGVFYGLWDPSTNTISV